MKNISNRDSFQIIEYIHHEQPFPHLHAKFSYSNNTSEFPKFLMNQSKRLTGSDKTYSVSTYSLSEFNASTIEPIPSQWKCILHQLTSKANIAAILNSLRLDSNELHRVEARFVSYNPTDWMSRHTDKLDKLFSAIYYFSHDWDQSFGGDLRLYKSEYDQEASCRIFPFVGSGVAFAPSPQSWHEVAPVDPKASQSRDAILLHGYRI